MKRKPATSRQGIGSASSRPFLLPAQFLLILGTATIYLLGLIMIYSASSAEILDLAIPKNLSQALFKQLGYTAIGIFLAVGVGRIGFYRIYNRAPLFFGIGVLLLLLVLVPGIGKVVNGSRRWLALGGFSFQPSEFVKLGLPLYFIYRYRWLEDYGFSRGLLCRLALTVATPLFLVFLEPNNGTMGVLGCTLLLLCWLMDVPYRYWVGPLLAFALLGVAVATQVPYVQARLRVYLNPEEDLLGKGHQPYQAKIAAGSGRFWGNGPGSSWQKLSFLPEAQNDYIAAIFAEEYGFVGMMGLIGLYATATLAAYTITMQTVYREQMLFRAVLTFLFAFQTFMNLGVVSGMLPSTGLNLPLFSQGGSSLMAHITALGFLLERRGSHTL